MEREQLDERRRLFTEQLQQMIKNYSPVLKNCQVRANISFSDELVF